MTRCRSFPLVSQWRCLIVVLVCVGAGSDRISAQSCSSSTTPSLNGKSWNSSAQKQLYVDPNLPQAVQGQIRQAAADFAAQIGQQINVLGAGIADPGIQTQGAIRMMNQPNGSPAAFANTAGLESYTSKGADTNKQISSTTNFNLGFNLVAASGKNPAVPAYDANQNNASQFIYDATLHELGHAFGLNDAPVPKDPTTGQPDYPAQTPGASIMNGYAGTNDQGPHGPANGPALPGGVSGTSVQPCDKSQINSANPPSSGGGGGSGGTGTGTGGGGAGGSNCLSEFAYCPGPGDKVY